MADGPPRQAYPALNGSVVVVEVPGDKLGVHLVCEVRRVGLAADQIDYRAKTTVCGVQGYRETTKTVTACDECRRALDGAMRSAMLSCTVRLQTLQSASERQ